MRFIDKQGNLYEGDRQIRGIGENDEPIFDTEAPPQPEGGLWDPESASWVVPETPLSDLLKFMLLSAMGQHANLVGRDELVDMIQLQQALETSAYLFEAIFPNENFQDRRRPIRQKEFATAAKVKIAAWARKNGQPLPAALEQVRQNMLAACDAELAKG